MLGGALKRQEHHREPWLCREGWCPCGALAAASILESRSFNRCVLFMNNKNPWFICKHCGHLNTVDRLGK